MLLKIIKQPDKKAVSSCERIIILRKNHGVCSITKITSAHDGNANIRILFYYEDLCSFTLRGSGQEYHLGWIIIIGWLSKPNFKQNFVL
jgi:hypothetical protein